MRLGAGRVLAAIGLGVALLLAGTGALYDPEPGPLRLPRQTVVVDGTRLAFHQMGQGPDVLLLHGGMGSAEDFERLFPLLAVGQRLTAVDRPGFGGSESRGEDHTISGNARLIAGLVRALGLARPVVVGHSHGGGVALRLAADAPELVGGLVLLAPAAYPSPDPPALLDRVTALPVLGEGLAAWVGPLVAPRMIRDTLVASLGPDVGRVPPDFVTWRTELWTNPRSLTTHARQNLTDPAELAALAPRYPELALPVVAMWCDEDPYEGGALDTARLAGELPRARETRLVGCGHYVQYGRPEAVIQAISSLAASVRSGG
jgi:pimeloyl-ACP methyl ester carboxylesterase